MILGAVASVSLAITSLSLPPNQVEASHADVQGVT